MSEWSDIVIRWLILGYGYLAAHVRIRMITAHVDMLEIANCIQRVARWLVCHWVYYTKTKTP